MTRSALTTRRRHRSLTRTGVLVAAAVATAIAVSATPAEASVEWYGSTTSATGTSSMINHLLSVSPVVSLMPGYTTQGVKYQVAMRDVTYSTNAPVSYLPWQGPWTASSLITTGTSCNTLNWTGCDPVYGPVRLPSYVTWGTAGHAYEVWVRAAFLATNGWYTSPWTHLESCRTYYSTNGVANSVLTNSCWT